jgi:hypothetical protein
VIVAFWSKKHSEKSVTSRKISPEELISIAKRYVVQETVVPLKRIAKVLAFGIAGALVFAIGAVIVLVGVLRILQTETGQFFSGSWTFAPYLLTAVVGIGIVPLVATIFMASLRVPESHREAPHAE